MSSSLEDTGAAIEDQQKGAELVRDSRPKSEERGVQTESLKGVEPDHDSLPKVEEEGEIRLESSKNGEDEDVMGVEKRSLGEELEKLGQVTQSSKKCERQPLTEEQRVAKKEKKKAKKARRIEQSHRDREIVEGLKMKTASPIASGGLIDHETPTSRNSLSSQPCPQISASRPTSSRPSGQTFGTENTQTQATSHPRGFCQDGSGGGLLGSGYSQSLATSQPRGLGQDGGARAFEPRRRSRSPSRQSWSRESGNVIGDSRRERPVIQSTYERFNQPAPSPYHARAALDPHHPPSRPFVPSLAPLNFQNRQLLTDPKVVQAAARLEEIEASNAALRVQLAGVEQRHQDSKRAEAAKKEQKVLILRAQSEYLKDRRARYQENLEYERLSYSRFKASKGGKDPVTLASVFEVYEKAVENIYGELGRIGEREASINQQLAELK